MNTSVSFVLPHYLGEVIKLVGFVYMCLVLIIFPFPGNRGTGKGANQALQRPGLEAWFILSLCAAQETNDSANSVRET